MFSLRYCFCFVIYFRYYWKYLWRQLGCKTPFVDKHIFGQILERLGGKFNILLSAGAPLNPIISGIMVSVFHCCHYSFLCFFGIDHFDFVFGVLFTI